MSLLALYSLFKFRTYGTLVASLLAYTFIAGVGYVAYQGGDFDRVAYLSVFITPFFSLMAMLVAGLFMGESTTKQIL